jgi:hypothetical protein
MSANIYGKAESLSLPALTRRVDTRSVRVGVLLAAIAILNGLDLLYTLFAQNIGMLDEMNPVTAGLLGQGFYGSAISFKIIMVICGLGILWKLRYSRLALPACWGLLITYVWLGTVWVQWVRLVNNTFELRLSSALR